jgi:hypothetical protein
MDFGYYQKLNARSAALRSQEIMTVVVMLVLSYGDSASDQQTRGRDKAQ